MTPPNLLTAKRLRGKAAPAPDAPKTVAEREMEFRKRQQERAESEKKAAEEQNKSAAKTAECDRARGYMKSLEDGVRIARTDASGNREFLDRRAARRRSGSHAQDHPEHLRLAIPWRLRVLRRKSARVRLPSLGSIVSGR